MSKELLTTGAIHDYGNRFYINIDKSRQQKENSYCRFFRLKGALKQES